MNRLVRQLLGEARSESIFSDQVTREVILEIDYSEAVNDALPGEEPYSEPASVRVIVGVYIDDSLPVDSAGEAVRHDESYSVQPGWEQRLTKQLEYFFRTELSGPYAISAHIVPQIVARVQAEVSSRT